MKPKPVSVADCEPWRFEFSSLSEKQRDVFGQIAMLLDSGHHPRTLQSLEKLGLITGYPAIVRGLCVRRWAVPIYVHIAWCEWCSKHRKQARVPHDLHAP